MSYSYSSSSTSYTSSSTSNGDRVSGTRTGQATYTDSSGQTHVKTAHQNLGEAPQIQQASYDAQGRQLVGEDNERTRIEDAGGSAEGAAGRSGSGSGVSSGGPQVRELDPQDENDRRYLERMEDE